MKKKELASIFEKHANTLIREEDGEVLTATNPSTGRTYIINDVAKRVLELLDGERDLHKIIGAIHEEYGDVPVGGQLESDVLTFITGALEADLITCKPEDQSGV